MSKSKAVGLKPKDRKITKSRANQWTGTPQQLEFMDKWLSPDSVTFGNAYQSALAVGYSKHYANQISSPAVGNTWIQDFTRLLSLTPEHITQGIQSLAIKANNSRSPDDTRLKAYEILAKITGVLNDKGNNTTTVIVQPILNSQSTRKTIDSHASATSVKRSL